MTTKEEYFEKYGVLPQAPQETALPITDNSVQEMRQRLELKKLEIEISKLEKPDTSIDYYSKMLELQEKNFAKQMEMAQQQGNLQLEIEKLKLGSGEDDSIMPYLQMLAPLLPEILKNKKQTPVKTTLTDDTGAKTEGQKPSEVQKELPEVEDMEVPTTAGELEEYKKEIRNGNITFEEAYKDFLTTPFASAITKEKFQQEFEKIKEEKVI